MKKRKLTISLAVFAIALGAFATTCPWPINPYNYGGDGCTMNYSSPQIDGCTQPTLVDPGCADWGSPADCKVSYAPLSTPVYASTLGGPCVIYVNPCTQSSTNNPDVWYGYSTGATCVDGNGCTSPPPHSIPIPPPAACPVQPPGG